MNLQEDTTAAVPSQRSYFIVIKATGSLCNLDCTYCYYQHKETDGGARCARPTLLSETETKEEYVPDLVAGRISDELLEEFIRKYIADQDVDSVLFNWHGGEPALLGLDFYRKAVLLQQKYAGTKRIENDFQTNGVLLDDAWCEFFKEHGFWVGLSIDGPKHLHDRLRRGKNNTPTFDLVYRAARLLQKHEVPFNPLTVVNSINVRYPTEVYRFLTEDLGCRSLQWLPCVQRKDFCTVAPGYWDQNSLPVMGTPAAKPGHPTSVVTDWSVDPDDWGEFLCQTFDLWRKDRELTVSVNWFNSLLGQWMGRQADICTLAGVCGRSLVTMEKDGSLYSCDHFVYPEYKLGNVCDKDRRPIDMVYSQQQRKFGTNKHNGLPAYCRRCKYNFACNGECPKNRFIKTPDGEPGLNYRCSGIKRFLTYAVPLYSQIVDNIPHPGRTAGLGMDVE